MKFNDLKIGNRMLFGFVLTTALAIVVGIIGYLGISRIVYQLEISKIVNRIIVDGGDAQAGSLRYIIYDDKKYFSIVAEESNNIKMQADEVKELLLSDRNKKVAENIKGSIAQYEEANIKFYELQQERKRVHRRWTEAALEGTNQIIQVIEAATIFSRANPNDYSAVERVYMVQEARNAFNRVRINANIFVNNPNEKYEEKLRKEIAGIKQIFIDAELIMVSEKTKNAMKIAMQSIKNYENEFNAYQEIIEKQLDIQADQRADAALLLSEARKLRQGVYDFVGDVNSSSISLLVIVLIFSVLSGLVIGVIITQGITKPLSKGITFANAISSGDLTQSLEIKQKDEVGKLAEAMKKMLSILKKYADFSNEIGKGDYETDFKTAGENDVLGNSLIKMRDELKNTAENNQIRTWTSTGIAKISEILRSDANDVKNLSENIIKSIVGYVNANQAALFVTDGEGDNECMAMTACYAWERTKYLQMKVKQGDGLIGQCWMEKNTIVLTELPQDFIRITSGLGETVPNSLLVVPLITNDIVYGVLELATFDRFKKHEIDFIEKIAESISATLNTVKINENTQKLLSEAQVVTEQMRTQEEELRQNFEELNATQEALGRKNKELEELTGESQNTLSAINNAMATIEFTPNGEVINANKNFLNKMGYTIDQIKGQHHRIFVPKNMRESAEYINFWKKLENGVSFAGTFKRIDAKGEVVYLNATYNAIKNSEGKVTRVMKFANITTNQEHSNVVEGGISEEII